jgi:yeast amino acid transporter
MGWDYALAWLTVLPFELVAASITIQFWREDINMGVWVAVFLVLLAVIQIFGVRGYGEVEFVLSIIKIAACTGFIILGIVINCGGVGDQGYLGAKYWYDPGAFQNGFNGFAGVFVVAAFAFGGTELVGLAAAESANPRRAIPMATKQVFWRIAFFYVVNLFILGLIVRSDDERLLGASGANTKASPFVIAIQDAGIQVLPSIFNAVITISVISVANSCTFGSTRTMQAMAERGMAPAFLAYVDKKGRPLWCIVVQIAFGLLAFIGESADQKKVFSWLLALSGLSYFFVWGSICLAHVRFRMAWKLQGFSLEQIPYRVPLGIWGSVIGLFLNALCLIATFYNALYVSLFPPGAGSARPTREASITDTPCSRRPMRCPTRRASSSRTSRCPSSWRCTSRGSSSAATGARIFPSLRSISSPVPGCRSPAMSLGLRRRGPTCPDGSSAVFSEEWRQSSPGRTVCKRRKSENKEGWWRELEALPAWTSILGN